MKFSSLLSSVVITTSVSAATYDQTIANRYIVEFHEQEEGIHKRFLDEGLPIEVRHLFDHDVFTGMSFDVRDSGLTYEALKKNPHVKNVWPVNRYAKRDNTYKMQNSPAWNPHVNTGVQELHNRNITGEGVVVGVIDTGADVNHPALKGKVISAVSFINSSTPLNGTIDCEGHGTGCASIIVGDTPQIMGVAPGAKIRAYQVTTCGIDATDELLILAALQAYDDKVDLISWSMGSTFSFGVDTLSQITARVAEKIPVVVSAGNEGYYGPYTANNLGAFGKAISVGLTVTEQVVTYNATFISSSGNNLTFPFLENSAISPNVSATYKVQLEGNLCKKNVTQASDSDTIIVGLSGSCPAQSFVPLIEQGGYLGAIVLYDPSLLGYLEVLDMNLQLLGAASSEVNNWIMNETSKNSTLKLFVSLDQIPGAMPRLSSISGAISSMSSWGPTFSQRFYPNIMAPGGDFLLAKPPTGYYEASGTSFACPYIAGVVALYLSTHKNASVDEVRNRLLASTNLLPQSIALLNATEIATFNKSTIAPLIQQGAGFIDAVQFFDKKTLLLSEPFLSLNDTKHRVSTFTISFRNGDSEAVTYDVSNKGFDTVYTRNSSWQIPRYYPNVTAQVPTASFILNQTVTLQPGQETSFNVTIQPPTNIDSYYAPVFEGAIIIQGSNNDTIRVPYIGSQYDVSEWLPFKQGPLVYYSADDELLPLEDIENTLSIPDLDISSLVLKFQMRFGSNVLSFRLVDHDYKISTFSPSSFERNDGFNGTLLLAYQGSAVISDFATWGVNSPGEFEILGVGEYDTAPPGQYRVLGYALKPFGNSEAPEDYQLMLSKDFEIVSTNGTNSTSSQSASLSTKRSEAINSSVSSWMAAMLLFISLFAV